MILAASIGGGIVEFRHVVDILTHHFPLVIAVIRATNPFLPKLVDAHIARPRILEGTLTIHTNDENVHSLRVLCAHGKQRVHLRMNRDGDRLFVVGHIHSKVLVHAVRVHPVSTKQTRGMPLRQAGPQGHRLQRLHYTVEPPVHVPSVLTIHRCGRDDSIYDKERLIEYITHPPSMSIFLITHSP